ncbi:MAG: hypothetical protein GX442_00200, partial [Candidatus Riflebacteria bacterium]|nr:hypothetical protein [Candidatus Riflebacteria bacterium]
APPPTAPMTPPSPKPASGAAAPAPAVSAPPPPAPAAGQMTLEPPRVAESIMARYPSFLTAPFGRLFEPDTPQGHLETLRNLLEALLGFLNFTFLQTYLFYGTRSPKGDQVVMDCLKCHLGGPSAVRSLHHLALVVKNVTGTDSFFTFALSRAMTEAGEANPLMVLKELWEFVLTPVDPLQETLPQAVEALPQVLMAFKGLLHNPLVMKSAPGAREAFFDLSGPRAAPLKPADRPGLDLPPGEIILLSKDRGEALGLFPYFTFNGERIVFAVPEARQTAILYERLELKEG